MKRSIIVDNFKNTGINPDFVGLGDLGEVKLTSDIPCIINKDNNEIISIPGITGSKKHKSNATDKNLVLEIANFDADKVAMASFKLNYRSPSSKIYSGEIEKKLSKIALIKYSQHLKGKGNIKKIIKTGDLQDQIISFEVSLDWIYNKISSKLSDQKKQLIKDKINLFGIYNEGVFIPNLYYNIIKNKYDLLQELIRLIGFDEVKDDLLQAPIQNNDTKSKNLIKKILNIKKFIASIGFNEVVTRPFVESSWLKNEEKSIRVINPNNETKPFLSDNLITRLVDCYNTNLNAGEKNLNIFEINSVFCLDSAGQTNEVTKCCLIFETEDAYKASSIANSLFNYLYSIDCKVYKNIADVFGNSFDLDNKLYLTQLSKKTLKTHSIPLTKTLWVIVFEINDNLNISEFKKYKDENQYSYIKRVVNFDIDETKSNIGEIKNKIINTDKFDISFDIVDIFKKDDVTTVSIELIFNNQTRNLTGQEVDEYLEAL